MEEYKESKIVKELKSIYTDIYIGSELDKKKNIEDIYQDIEYSKSEDPFCDIRLKF